MKTEYRERMTPDEIFEAAGKGRELFNLEPAEDALFARAKLIYTLFKHEELDAEAGAERRRLAIMQYEQAVRWRDFDLRWADHARELYRAAETAAAAYIHEPGYRTADSLWQAVTGVAAKVQLKEAKRGDFFDGADPEQMQQLRGVPDGDVQVLEEVGV